MPLPMVVDTPFRSEERFTQQEFFEWLQRRPAADVNHYELIRGRIVMSPPAGWPHGSLGSRINARLYGVVERYGLGIVQDSSAGYDLPSDAECGVGEYWIVDPDRRVVTVYHWGDAGYGTGERIHSGRIASHALPQLELTVEDLLAD